MKKVLGLIGVGLIIGSAVYMLFNKNKKKKDIINTSSEDFSLDDTVSIINQNDTYADSAGFEDVKASAVGTIYTRHEEASNIMKEAVDIICSRSEISEDENCDLDQISNELDELLREE